MGNNNTVYTAQVQQLVNDLTKWKSYVDTNSSIILSFQDTIETIQDQIDWLNTKIDALNIKVDKFIDECHEIGDPDYVKLSKNSITMEQYRQIAYSDNGAIINTGNMYAAEKFDSYTNLNDIYVYSNKTISGLTIDGYDVIDVNSLSDTSYFYKFNGSSQGITHKIKTINAQNISGIKLYFSNDNNFQDILSGDSSADILNITIGPATITRDTTVSAVALADMTTGESAYAQQLTTTTSSSKKTTATQITRI